ncbi:conserved hypothetical protein [Verrucomicrobia bacterium]|nr:conserved hypothetical protein [Verrucomicrobiota bacterium]
MARKLRVQYPGAIYHVTSRGDGREGICRTDRDRKLFLATLGEACAKTDWQVHAWCLMGNQFHLVVETPKPNLVEGMKWFMGAYTIQYNRRHKRWGNLFSGRYKALFVDGSSKSYLKTVCDYVHLNPARAGLLGPRQELSSYPWSSYGEYLQAPRSRYRWLRVDRLFRAWDIPSDSAAGRREFERRMEARRAAEDGEQFKPVLRGWCFGGKAFRQELLRRMRGRVGTGHLGREIPDTAKAERIVREEFRRAGWSEKDLGRHRKGDPKKVRIALRLRNETTVTLAWISQRLRMGVPMHVAHLLYWRGRDKKRG